MIDVVCVNKYYNIGGEKFYALKDINLKIEQNSTIMLNGVSGSGKSTLISIIAGVLKPDSGEVIIDNERITKLSDGFSSSFRNRHIGLIFQKFHLIGDMSVIDNVIMPLIPTDISEEALYKRAEALLEKFNIKSKQNLLAHHLSGGEAQRVAIARALINEPKIVLADEPTANLDKKLKGEFLDYLDELKKLNKTIILATHDNLFENFSFDKRVFLKDGKIDDKNGA